MLKMMQFDQFDQVFKLMQETFPIDEYRPYGIQKALLNKPEFKIYVVNDSDSKQIKAFISVWDLKKYTYIDHFVVNPTYRQAGLGSAILKQLKDMSSQQIIFEVEPICNEITLKRVQFYERNGFFLNPYDYMQPPIAVGRASIELKIMTSDYLVNKNHFNDIVATLYHSIYSHAFTKKVSIND